MKKKTQILLISLWGLAVAGSRICYLFLNRQSVADTYEYFANAMIQAEKNNEFFTSGLAHVYTERLSDLLLFAGNRIETVCVYQAVLQILWISFLFAGISLIFGKLSGIVSSTILAALPMTFGSMMEASTENFYMLHLSINLIVLGVFYLQAQKAAWHEKRLCELYLLVSGFYMGVICIWNYVGFLLIAVAVYLLIRNYSVLKEKIKVQKGEKGRKPQDRIMTVGYQGFLLFSGILVGMFATLMKYTGLTGYTLKEQFDWWRFQMESFPGRCQDISTWIAIAFTGAVLIGALCQRIFPGINSSGPEKMKDSRAVEKEAMKSRKEEEHMEEKQEEYITTKDGRKIRLLDNPLPTPKKHIKKEMGFDFDFDDNVLKDNEKSDKIDFDVEISDNDDFDFT